MLKLGVCLSSEDTADKYKIFDDYASAKKAFDKLVYEVKNYSKADKDRLVEKNAIIVLDELDYDPERYLEDFEILECYQAVMVKDLEKGEN